FVVDHMGTVAALDGRTGAINWLTLVGDRAATMDARVTMQMNRSNAETVPLLVDAGLIVTSRNVAQVMLLDPATGAKIRDLGDPAFARAALLVPCEGDVLAVGRTVHRLDGRT